MTLLKWLLIILLVVLLLLIILFVTKISVFLNYYHHNDNDHLKVEFKAWFGLIKYKLEIPLMKIDDNSPTIVTEQENVAGGQGGSVKKDTKQHPPEDLLASFRDMKELISKVVNLHRIVRKFLKKITIKQFEWHTLVGIGDAAYTGMLTGALWAVKGGVIGLISHFMKLQTPPIITITPQFQFAVSQTSISCIFQFRIGHAIFAGMKIIKYWKGGRPNFRTKPLSALSSDKTKSI